MNEPRRFTVDSMMRQELEYSGGTIAKPAPGNPEELRLGELLKWLAMDLVRECRLAWNFIRYDFSATLVPATLFTVAAWKATGSAWSKLPLYLSYSTLYFTLYALCFCVAGQMVNTAEDRLNKPDRPIISGQVDLRGAMARWAIYMAAYTLVGYKLGVLKWTLLWQAVCILHDPLNCARHWLMKNLFMGAGTVVMLVAAWELVAPLTPVASQWVVFLALTVFSLVPLQDLRDLEGDRAVGRRTFPLAWGEAATRGFLAVGFLALAAGTHTLLMAPASGWVARVCDAALVVLAVTISARVMLRRGRSADHQTYLLFTYWYCGALASAILVL